MAKSKIPLTPEGGTRGVICQVESLFSFVSSKNKLETLRNIYSYCSFIPPSEDKRITSLRCALGIPPLGARGIGVWGITFILLFSLLACNQTQTPNTEGIISGTTTIVADESVFTIVDDEAEIFALNYKQAQIKFNYQPEQKLVKLFLSDSIKTAIMARDLTPQEKQHFLDQKIVIRTNRFAIDGIALIVNKASTDSVITIQQLNDALVGKFKSDKAWVFDNTQSSTLAYLMQFAGVKTFASNVYALQSNKEVIKYVSAHPQAVGVVSLSWLVRPTPDVENELKNIKLLALSGDDKKYHKPTQSTLKTGKYPLTRNLFIHNCQGSAGLGTGFASFLAGELGQRIILKAGLAPDSLPSRQLNFK
jgi:phosphate transport system substrate-binding protein